MCIIVQKVGFLKYKSGLLHGYKMKIWIYNSNKLAVCAEQSLKEWDLIFAITVKHKIQSSDMKLRNSKHPPVWDKEQCCYASGEICNLRQQ